MSKLTKVISGSLIIIAGAVQLFIPILPPGKIVFFDDIGIRLLIGYILIRLGLYLIFRGKRPDPYPDVKFFQKVLVYSGELIVSVLIGIIISSFTNIENAGLISLAIFILLSYGLKAGKVVSFIQSRNNPNKPELLGTRNNGDWIAIFYDIKYKYGYEKMLQVLDSVSEEAGIGIEVVHKARMAGTEHLTVWEKGTSDSTCHLCQLDALSEECGEVAIGGSCKLEYLPRIYITMCNQTSIIIIQVPETQYTEEGKVSLTKLAKTIQSKVIAIS